MAKQDIDPNYLDPGYEPIVNHSDNTPFHQVLSARMQRRTVMKGSAGAALASLLGLSLAGCGSDSDGNGGSTSGNVETPQPDRALGFQAVPVSSENTVIVPEGYSATPFLPWGTPITGSMPEFANGANTGAEQEQQMGMHHDGMHFFPIDLPEGGNSSTEGLLVMNHENLSRNDLHVSGPTPVDGDGFRVEDEVRKEIAAHGVSVVHIKRDTNGVWDVVHASNYNRRITGNTEMEIRGPLRGNSKLFTKFSPDGTRTRGTLNNCSMGATPWGTYLTAEENWHGYFMNADANRPREQVRYGIDGTSNYDWELAKGGADQYIRFNTTPTGASAADDYRNEANTYGYMVEIDPFDPTSTPQKRTALGRFGHEGVIFAPAVEGQPIVCYSGDDVRFECIYKFVSKNAYYADTADGSLLDEGTLYVARFNDDGTGDWLPLDLSNAEFKAKVDAAVGTDIGTITGFTGFADQADLLLNTRLAADIAGATKMDRPEWGAVDPNNGMVYFTLTNNSRRGEDETNAANPIADNQTGHIIRWAESAGDHAATSFEWDIFVFGGNKYTSTVVDGEAVITLDETNIFSSPDGLWFDYNGRLWIQTDNGYAKETFGNDMMLAANPETRELKRFLVGPKKCEVTGVVTTPDCKTMFVNIQHPGEYWPDPDEARARCSTMIITRNDGGVIGA